MHSHSSGNVSPERDVQLGHSREERSRNEKLADLYSIILATEHLESAYVRDAVCTASYALVCAKMIAQVVKIMLSIIGNIILTFALSLCSFFKTLKEAVSLFEPDISAFMQRFHMQCPAAANRLLHVGVPATVEHGDNGSDFQGKSNQLYVAETVQHFITAMDSLKLDMRAVDEVHPHLNNVMDSLNKIVTVRPDHGCKTKVKAWLATLNSMRASDELDEDQCRQLLFDLDLSYNEFVQVLTSNS